eukprot:gene25001-biopygen23954
MQDRVAKWGCVYNPARGWDGMLVECASPFPALRTPRCVVTPKMLQKCSKMLLSAVLRKYSAFGRAHGLTASQVETNKKPFLAHTRVYRWDPSGASAHKPVAVARLSERLQWFFTLKYSENAPKCKA